MNFFDQTYLDLLRDVMENGSYKDDRTGTGIYSVFSREMRFDLSTGQVPLLTTKKMHVRSIIHELLWYLRADTNIGYLNDNKVRIWDEWATPNGSLGPVYGQMWRAYPAPDLYTLVPRRTVTDNSVLRDEYDDKTPSYDKVLGFVGELMGDMDEEEERLYNFWWKFVQLFYEEPQQDGVITIRKGDILCKRWHNFGCFRDDIRKMPGFWSARKSTDYTLYNKFYGETNLYHPDTCVFLPSDEAILYENTKMASPIKMVSASDGSVLFFPSIGIAMKRFVTSTVDDFIQALSDGTRTIDGYVLVSMTEHARTGFVVRKFQPVDQIAKVIHDIRNTPTSRRLLVSAWNPTITPDDDYTPDQNAEMGRQALPPCHYDFQFWVDPDKKELSLKMIQRSCDVFLGVPFNIIQYSLLLLMVAKITGYTAKDFIWSGGDVHLYSNHLDQAKEQLERGMYQSPSFEFARDVKEIEDFRFEDFVIKDYEHHAPIKAPIAV